MHTFNTNKQVIHPPDEWVYRHCLPDLKGDLDGRTLKTYSVFNSEKTPSMFIYYRDGKYRWKDHSSGKQGDAIDLAHAIFELASGEVVSWKATVDTLNYDYNKWKEKNPDYQRIEINKTHYAYDLVCEFYLSSLQTIHLQYWSRFGVEEELLSKYNIKPLAYFKLGKKFEGRTLWHKAVEINHSYGFFQNDGALLKIYNPYYDPFKHVTLKSETLGREQLDNLDTLIICSSMKDMLALKSLELAVDVIAPIGEKVMIPKTDIDIIRALYKNTFTIFDNDKTGIRAMMLYKALYDIDFIYAPGYKDLAEYRENTTTQVMKDQLTISINKKLQENAYQIGWKEIEIEGSVPGVGYF